jgi:hypothetical protein
VREFIHNSSITGADPLAAQGHTEFEELCALATSGELTDAEQSRLRDHLQYCDICRAALSEYEYLAAEVMPAVGAATEPQSDDCEVVPSLDLERGERRLLDELASREASRKKKHKGFGKAMLLIVILGAVTTSIAISIHVSHDKTASSRGVSPIPWSVVAPLPATSAAVADLESQRKLARYRSEIDALERHVRHEAALRDQSQEEIGTLTQELQAERDARSRLDSAQEQLNQQLFAAQADATALRDKAAVSAMATAQLASLQQQVGKLQTELEERDRNLAESTELLSHDRDIRDLIGARNLLIADIHDVSQAGVLNRPFGRIFYTRDRSLVCYGYDLDKQPGLKKSVAFQAWGSSGGGQDVSLGLFYQDDSKKRWVLKFNDSKT